MNCPTSFPSCFCGLVGPFSAFNHQNSAADITRFRLKYNAVIRNALSSHPSSISSESRLVLIRFKGFVRVLADLFPPLCLLHKRSPYRLSLLYRDISCESHHFFVTELFYQQFLGNSFLCNTYQLFFFSKLVLFSPDRMFLLLFILCCWKMESTH